MSSEGAPPPDDGSTPATTDQKANPPEKPAAGAEPEPSPPAPAGKTDAAPAEPAPEGAEAETNQPQPAAGAAPVNPAAAAAGATGVVPGQQQQPANPAIPAGLAPPPPVRRKPPAAKHKSGGEEVDPAMLIGVAAGAGLLLAFIVALVCCACCKKKRKNKHQPYGGHHDQMQSYASGPHHGGQFYTNHPPSHSHQKKWHSPEHVLHIPPPMGVPGGTWGGPFSPTPPGGGCHSTDMGSTISSPGSHAPPPPSFGFNKNAFSYDELAAATSGFSQSNLLGQGGFGYVHKGVLPNGKEIAVKSLKSGSGQGEREFQAEVEIISRVHHRHLVSLVGYCIAGGQRMLVYEYVPNNNLEFHLHGRGRPPLEWGMRMKIAMGSAKGLAYLHEDCHPRIIHRDIKTANILLDHSFEAQVADFGLAKLSSDNYTHVSTRIMGTFGYLAPEYASSGKLTEKSDVYSFGVMLLELITGRRPIDMTGQMDESLVDWARPLLQRAMEDGDYEPFADPSLGNKYLPHEMRRMVACASSSVRHNARRRPKMSQIVRALEGDVSLEDLHEGVKPGQSTTFGGDSEDGTTYSTQMRQFRKMALETQEYTSSEYGATSEYGLNPSPSTDSGESASSTDQVLKPVP